MVVSNNNGAPDSDYGHTLNRAELIANFHRDYHTLYHFVSRLNIYLAREDLSHSRTWAGHSMEKGLVIFYGSQALTLLKQADLVFPEINTQGDNPLDSFVCTVVKNLLPEMGVRVEDIHTAVSRYVTRYPSRIEQVLAEISRYQSARQESPAQGH